MSTTATLIVAQLAENITEARSTLPAAASPSLTRLKTSLTEKKRHILSNVSPALAHDIELKRREQAAQKHAPATNPITVDTTINASPPHHPPSLSRPASSLLRQPDYCTYRPPLPRGTSLYHPPSPSGRPCTCPTPHLPLHPSQWRTTPSEAPTQHHTKVHFAPNPVSSTHIFPRWYKDEYEHSNSYHAKGPVRITEDWSTAADDEFEIQCLDAMEGVDLDEGDEVMGEIKIEEMGFEGDGGPLVRMC